MDKEQLHDVRVFRHRMKVGAFTREEQEAYLASLPDDADEATETQVRFTASWASRQTKAADAE